MGVRALLAALVFVIVGAVVFTVSVVRTGPPEDSITGTAALSVSGEGSADAPTDPDVVITFRPGTPRRMISDFASGMHEYIQTFQSVHADYERERLLLTWNPATSEELRKATVLVLEEAFPVAAVSRVR
ncbi:MAG TPA: hypothetical protein VGB03_02950 [Acidimicrobiales bacterium]|jgi:hypothetical protein